MENEQPIINNHVQECFYFHFIGGDFGYSSITIDVTSCNLFEFEIASDISMLCVINEKPNDNLRQAYWSILHWP
jgi:hypothetical protein